jgi:outer membrane receptor protein involved in Fe transport
MIKRIIVPRLGLRWAAAAIAVGVVATITFAPRAAHAQSSTTGAVIALAKDPSGKPLGGVTVTVTSPALGGQAQSCFTEENGACKISELPPGEYLATFFYLEITIQQKNLHIGVDKTATIVQVIDESKGKGEKIVVEAKAPLIDTTTQRQGITLDKEYLKNIPVPGRTFDAALGAAAGSQNDGLGTSFSGSSSLENQYIVDGVNTTGLTYGTVGSPIVNDFIEEIEVITGGYQAEYGRATGGVVNVVTKTGSNEFKGSIFGYLQPGALTFAATPILVNASSISLTPNLNYNGDLGFEIGGPIIKDKLWFFIGVDPQFSKTDYTRTVNSQTDCRVAAKNGIASSTDYPGLSICDPKMHGDGYPDIDPRTGFYIVDPIYSEIRSITQHNYNTLAKINYAATPQHQGQIAFQMMPSGASQPGLLGPANAGTVVSDLTFDLSGKWTSKFNDNKTEIMAVIGWHRDYISSDALDPTLQQTPAQVIGGGDLFNYAGGGTFSAANGFGEAQPVVDGCRHNTGRYPQLGEPCPMTTESYIIGGPGTINRDTEERKAAKVELTQRAKVLGTHEIKIGLDGEDNVLDKARLYSGGNFIQNIVGQEIDVYRWVKLGGNMAQVSNPDPTFFNQLCTTPPPAGGGGIMNKSLTFYCAYLSGVPGSQGTQIHGETLNWAGYARDSWQPKPNITINAGIRYEEQYLRYASFLQNSHDPLTNDKLGANAMQLKGNWAPRIGISWDPTKEGRSKLYASWGRFYEAIPMDINERSFGGEVSQLKRFSPGQCGMIDPRIGQQNGINCPATMPGGIAADTLVGASGELIEPGISAEYMDEIIAGAEFEVLDDLKLGIAYQHRAFGRIIEDVSTDGANTYIIANPGEFSSVEENKLVSQINATDDPALKAHLQHELDLYKGIRNFDHGIRNYDALQFTLTRRFSKKLYVQASYTYSRTIGNYPGSISYQNGQVDPNISSQFDLIELLANRYGPLPQDRPHYIKLDGYYTFDMKKAGDLTVGIRLRALSGVPINALGAHYLYGPNESYLLPQGSAGRTDFDHGLDVNLIYGKRLPRKNMKVEGILTFFNIYNRQGTFNVDNTYAESFRLTPGAQSATAQYVNPISGGSYDDLIWSKVIVVDRSGQPQQTAQPIGRNANFKNTASRYAPEAIRVAFRLTF